MVEEVGIKQIEFLKKKDNKEQKALGQYFTEVQIAEYMSSLVDISQLDKDNVNILDCGAGYGVLTVSAAIFCLKHDVNKVHATLYEIDKTVLSELRNTMNLLASEFNKEQKEFSYEIKNQDFVLERPDLNVNLKYDISIINPPYFKYSVTDSLYAKQTSDLFKGDPNIYASFIAVMLASLKYGGQAVIISPRSFLNGLYFKGFRKYLLSNADLQIIHIFKSRNKVFINSDVLQENIIFKIQKSLKQSSDIIISTSLGVSDLKVSEVNRYPKKIIIDQSNDEKIIRVPETIEDYEILCKAELFPSTFTDEGYYISTGPVVEHRTSQYLTTEHDASISVPLIKAHNISIDGIKWDGSNQKDLSFTLLNSYEKHLLGNFRYVLVKRFTAKDEMKRFVAAVYNPIFNQFGLIGITNKLNYIGRKDEDISEIEASGLAALFNSTFMDNYYRCISGSTQVNATDVKILKFPFRKTIICIGEQVVKHKVLNNIIIDDIIIKSLKI